jgi:hypothetical protein
MASVRKHRGRWQVRVRRHGVALTKTFTLKQDAEQWARNIVNDPGSRRVYTGNGVTDR